MQRCTDSRLDEPLSCCSKPRLANQVCLSFLQRSLVRSSFFLVSLGEDTGRSLASRQRVCVRGEMNENWRREKRGSEREKEDGTCLWLAFVVLHERASERAIRVFQFARNNKFFWINKFTYVQFRFARPRGRCRSSLFSFFFFLPRRTSNKKKGFVKYIPNNIIERYLTIGKTYIYVIYTAYRKVISSSNVDERWVFGGSCEFINIWRMSVLLISSAEVTFELTRIRDAWKACLSFF